MANEPNMLLALVVSLLLVTGSTFGLLGALGVLRFPDIYTRMHAASKAGTVGSGLLLLAAGLHALDLGILVRTIAGIVFLILTAPVSAHLLAKAAFQAGYKPAGSAIAAPSPRKTAKRH